MTEYHWVKYHWTTDPITFASVRRTHWIWQPVVDTGGDPDPEHAVEIHLLGRGIFALEVAGALVDQNYPTLSAAKTDAEALVAA